MANKEHFQPLVKAIATSDSQSWNYWRIDHHNLTPDLNAVDLREVSLCFANFSETNLSDANLSRTNLFHADLRNANLSRANLRSTNLCEADLSGANLRWADLTEADLRNADLSDADLRHADLSGADMTGANLRGTNLSTALLDVEAFKRPRNWFGAGVSRIEKAALRLVKRKEVRGSHKHQP